MRIEDLDRPRVLAGCAAEQIETLRAFGLEPDGEILFQSDRSAVYDDYFERLRLAGSVYPCRCSRREIDLAASAPHGAEGPRYQGTCRNAEIVPADIRVWRFRAVPGSVDFDDEVFGRQAQNVAEFAGDFIVRRDRPEKTYAYQFAVVVDDALQRVTRVVRGADLLASTPRQILLQRALRFSQPAYAHVPLLVDRTGEKFSKRLASESIAGAKTDVERRALVGRVLGLFGQPPVLEEAAASFDLARIPRAAEIRISGSES